jgi:succinoglycan biosynthesis transport protein ExoP
MRLRCKESGDILMAEDRNGFGKPLTPEETAIMRPFTSPRPASLNYGYGYNGYEANEQNNGIHLREIWRIIRKRKWLVTLIAGVATLLVTIEVHRTPSIYRAQSDVVVSKDNATVVQTKDQVIQIDDSGNLNTAKIIIKSRPLLEDIVVSLKLDQNPNFIQSLQKRSVADAIKDIFRRVSGGVMGPKKDETPVSSIAAAQKDRTQEESARLAPYVNILKGKLNVDVVNDSNVLRISFEHTDPSIAAAVVNTAANNFLDRSYERKTARYADTSNWLDRSTRELKAKVQQAEQAMADYTNKNGIFTTNGQETLTTDKLTLLHSQATKAEMDRMIKETLYEEVKQGRVAQLPENFSDPKMALLKTELQKLEVDASELAVRFGPENPKVVEIQQKIKTYKEQIADSRQSIEGKLKADFERAVRDEAQVKRALERAKAEAVVQNQNAIQFNIIKSEVDTAKTLYTEFLSKTKQADLQLAEQQNPMRVIEPAEVPGSPVGPQRFRTILIGLLVSLVGAAGLAFFLEYLDNTVKSVEDIIRIAQLPTLAVIPSINAVSQRQITSKKKSSHSEDANGGVSVAPVGAQAGMTGKLQKLVTLDQLSSVVEAYRMLRTSVLLSAAGNPPKTILFTSGQPGEGKTTTAINTAISLSQLGASILLIDADLRRPTVHRVFKMNPTQGLSTYLSRQVEVEPLIQNLWVPNLSILPCGPIPPNPAELISSDRMKELLRDLSGKYDHILIDSPPLTNVTDPVILSTMVDGVILVVQAGRTTRDLVRRARTELSSVGAKIFGVVLNNLDIKREGYDSYLSTYGSYGYESQPQQQQQEVGRR